MNRMKRILLIACLLWFPGFLVAQLIPLNYEYLLNPVLVNPACAGLDGSTTFSFTLRKQWDGIKDAPEFQSIGLDSRLQKMAKYDHSGVKNRKYIFPSSGKAGLYFNATHDVNAPFTRSGFQFGYAYHSPLSRGKAGILSTGIGFQLYQQKLDLNYLEEFRNSDPALLNYENSLIPNLAAGIVYQYKNLRFQAAGLFLIPTRLNQAGAAYSELTSNQWFIAGSYTFKLSENLKYTPQFVYKSVPGRLEFNQEFELFNYVIIQTIWNSEEQAGILAGLRLGNYRVGYAFDYQYGAVKSYVEGSHMIYFLISMPELNKVKQ